MARFQSLPFGMSKLRRVHFVRLAIAVIVLLVAIQFVPYGHDHTNPPASQPVHWNSPQTAALVSAACYDCHSDQTAWRWYTSVAPASWLAQADVNGGRNRLNFSNLSQHPVSTQRIVHAIQSGSMPPIWYTPLHPNARLSSANKQALISGIEATFGNSGSYKP